MMNDTFPVICITVLIIFVGTLFYICTSSQIVLLYSYSEIENTTGTQGACVELTRQYLILADLRILQAVQYILEKNTTGVSDQLSTANKLLDEAEKTIWCH
jgi:hypothetical protein